MKLKGVYFFFKQEWRKNDPYRAMKIQEDLYLSSEPSERKVTGRKWLEFGRASGRTVFLWGNHQTKQDAMGTFRKEIKGMRSSPVADCGSRRPSEGLPMHSGNPVQDRKSRALSVGWPDQG